MLTRAQVVLSAFASMSIPPSQIAQTHDDRLSVDLYLLRQRPYHCHSVILIPSTHCHRPFMNYDDTFRILAFFLPVLVVGCSCFGLCVLVLQAKSEVQNLLEIY